MLFDLEILLVYPYSVSAYNNSYYGLFFLILFILVLTAGFVFEFGRGALQISSRQTGYLVSSNLEVKESKNSLNLYHRGSVTYKGKRYYSSQSSPSSSSVVPVRVYNNLDLDKIDILKENKGKSCVYLLKNLENGKTYIGSSVNLTVRV